jgi:hypothetical protein
VNGRGWLSVHIDGMGGGTLDLIIASRIDRLDIFRTKVILTRYALTTLPLSTTQLDSTL